MFLKDREKKPIYTILLQPDFEYLFQCLEEFEKKFIGHIVLDSSLYHQEITRIKKEWQQRGQLFNGTRSLDKDLADLYSAFEVIKGQQVLAIAILNQLFGRIYSYFPDLVKDNEIGYLTDDEFKSHLQSYSNAIAKCKNLNLDVWEKPEVIQILRFIEKPKLEGANPLSSLKNALNK